MPGNIHSKIITQGVQRLTERGELTMVGIQIVETVSVLISMNYEPQQWPQKVEISSPKSNYWRPCPESHNKIP